MSGFDDKYYDTSKGYVIKKHKVPEIDQPFSNASQDFVLSKCLDLESEEECKTFITFETPTESETQKNVTKNEDSKTLETESKTQTNFMKDVKTENAKIVTKEVEENSLITSSDNASMHNCSESDNKTSTESKTQINFIKDVEIKNAKIATKEVEENSFMTSSDNANMHNSSESDNKISTESKTQINLMKDVETENSKIATKEVEENSLMTSPDNASMHNSSESDNKTSTESKTQINLIKDVETENSKIATKEVEENSLENVISYENTSMIQLTPIGKNEFKKKSKKSIENMLRFAPWPPISSPNFKGFQIVLAVHHLVPSLPIGLFEVFAEIIEVVTNTPVILILESREDRSIATNYVDIAVMPPDETWDDGELLPASFAFEHPLNKDEKAKIYADIIFTKDRSLYNRDVTNLRGYKWTIPHKWNHSTPSGLLLNYLYSRDKDIKLIGDNILFVRTQLGVLEAIVNKEAEMGLMESPVLKYHLLPEHLIDSINILASIGPFPPYRIMVNKKTIGNPKLQFIEKLTTYLLKVNQYKEWKDRLSPYGVAGFAKNSWDLYSNLTKYEDSNVKNDSC